MKLHNIQMLVRNELMTNPRTRNDDNLLYLAVSKDIVKSIEFLSFGTVLTHINEYGLPTFESVRRTRQKLQAQYPELLPTEETVLKRRKKEEEYLEYVRT